MTEWLVRLLMCIICRINLQIYNIRWPEMIFIISLFVVNPLSLNVADLQHLGIELFCGFSLYNAFRPSSESITVSLLVLPLSQALVIEAG